VLVATVTDVLCPPQAGSPSSFSDVQGLKAFDPARDESYIDVEPTTGRTMNARIQLQLSAGTNTGIFSLNYPSVYQSWAVPVMYVT
jgi:hypothetical protein